MFNFDEVYIKPLITVAMTGTCMYIHRNDRFYMHNSYTSPKLIGQLYIHLLVLGSLFVVYISGSREISQSSFIFQTHYKRLLTLVEEATEHYQKITLNKTRRVSKENIHERMSTTHDHQDTNSVHSVNGQDDVSPVPDPRNGIGTLPTDSQVMDTPWRIFFPETCTTHQITQTVTSDSTNQTAHDISTNQSVPDNSTNQNAHDVTGESTNKRTEGETVPTEPTNQNTGNVDFHVTNKGFHWNVDATEFIPLFL